MIDSREQQTLAWLERAQNAVSRPAATPARIPRVVTLSRQPSLSGPIVVEGQYDAASTNEFTKQYWMRADGLSADEAQNPGVRATIRERARFECIENDSVLNGIVNQISLDLIGTGPRPQISFRRNPEDNRPLKARIQNRRKERAIAAIIERLWREWSEETLFAKKLRVGRIAKAVDGEMFLRKVTDDALESPVSLNLADIEADQISTPMRNAGNPREIDGLLLDENLSRVIAYCQLKYHPGSPWGARSEHEFVPRRRMFHLFRQQRPGQHRGISELAPALPEAALLRDYKIAVLHAARTAAKHSGVLETNSPELGEEDLVPLSSTPIDHDTFTALPKGYKLTQLRAEQPTTTFNQFHDAIVNNIARCVLMPFNIAIGNSAAYNYASGRLDFQGYDFAIWEERGQFERELITPTFRDWLYEAQLAGVIPQSVLLEDIECGWMWDGRGHVDPTKEANAAHIRLADGTTHRRKLYAEEGYDIDVEDAIAAQDSGFGGDVEAYRRAVWNNLTNMSGIRDDSADLELREEEVAIKKTQAQQQARQAAQPATGGRT